MEVICFGLGMLVGGAFFGWLAYYIGSNKKQKEEVFDAEEKRAETRLKKQMANFYAYDGSSNGQEAVD